MGFVVAKSEELQTISINLSREIVKKMQSIKYNKGISVSAIVEAALTAFLEGDNEEELADFLRQRGASLRRQSG